jgi:hypothetical protein
MYRCFSLLACCKTIKVLLPKKKKKPAKVMHKQFFTCALLLLVRQNLTSKSDAQAIFHMCTTFAGSSKFNQQK